MDFPQAGEAAGPANPAAVAHSEEPLGASAATPPTERELSTGTLTSHTTSPRVQARFQIRLAL